ncbi:DUF5316 family protein [Bacillus songklensis]|uniref:DUF5316 family protein n=1 Tax=Bacillus songklensis TaxID=1069116 RepID=A0ABV8B7C9_9BACI
MRLSLLSGVLLSLFMITISQAVSDYFWLVLICGGLGAASFALSGILVGSWNGGADIRANVHSETEEHRAERTAWALHLFFFGLPNVVAACTGWFLL